MKHDWKYGPPWWLVIIFLVLCLALGLYLGLQFVHPSPTGR